VAQQLFDARLDPLRVLPEPLEWVGVPEQGQHPLADKVDVGLGPGDPQQDEHRQ